MSDVAFELLPERGDDVTFDLAPGVGGGTVDTSNLAKLNESNIWTAYPQTMSGEVPLIPAGEVGSVEMPLLLVHRDDEGGELFATFSVSLDFGGGQHVHSTGVRWPEFSGGTRTGRYFYLASGPTGIALLVADDSTIAATFAPSPVVWPVAEATNDDHAVPKAQVEGLVQAIEDQIPDGFASDAITLGIEAAGLFHDATNQHQVNLLTEGILDRPRYVMAANLEGEGAVDPDEVGPTFAHGTPPSGTGAILLMDQPAYGAEEATEGFPEGEIPNLIYRIGEDGRIEPHVRGADSFYPVGNGDVHVLNTPGDDYDGLIVRYLDNNTEQLQRAGGAIPWPDSVSGTWRPTYFLPVGAHGGSLEDPYGARAAAAWPSGFDNSDGGVIAQGIGLVRVTDNGSFTLPTPAREDTTQILGLFVAATGATIDTVVIDGTGEVNDYALTDGSFVLLAWYPFGGGYWWVLTDTADLGGGGGGPALSDALPEAPGAASAGVSIDASRADHVHAPPSAGQIGAATADHDHAGVYQAADADLTALAALTSPATKIPTAVILGADRGTTSTTLADTTGLSFPYTSGVSYCFRAVLFVTGDTAGDLKVAFTHAGGTLNVGQIGINNGASALPANMQTGAVVTSSGTAVGDLGTFTGSTVMHVFEGTFIASSSGTFQVQHACRGATGTTTVKAGSVLTYFAA